MIVSRTCRLLGTRVDRILHRTWAYGCPFGHRHIGVLFQVPVAVALLQRCVWRSCLGTSCPCPLWRAPPHRLKAGGPSPACCTTSGISVMAGPPLSLSPTAMPFRHSRGAFRSRPAHSTRGAGLQRSRHWLSLALRSSGIASGMPLYLGRPPTPDLCLNTHACRFPCPTGHRKRRWAGRAGPPVPCRLACSAGRPVTPRPAVTFHVKRAVRTGHRSRDAPPTVSIHPPRVRIPPTAPIACPGNKLDTTALPSR